MTTPNRPLWHLAAPAALVAALGLAACASEPPAPVQEISSARAAISRAEQDGAPQLAPQPLRTAQDKLARARSSPDHVLARRWAEQAEVDADLAAAQARAARAETAATDLGSAGSMMQERQERAR